MKKIVLVLAFLGLMGCGTDGIEIPSTDSGADTKTCTQWGCVNECWEGGCGCVKMICLSYDPVPCPPPFPCPVDSGK